MLRTLASRASASGTSKLLRQFTGSSAALDEAKSSADSFLDKFKSVAPSIMDPPKFPTDFAKNKMKEVDPAAPAPSKVSFNFYLPHQVIHAGTEIDMVLMPATTGDFGVMPGHVPAVAQLRPGVITVHKELDKEVEKYFVSSGFAFVHPDSSTDVCCVEAVPVEELDPAAVAAGLADYTSKLAAAQAKGDDYETATAQIGVDVFSAMNSALTTK